MDDWKLWDSHLWIDSGEGGISFWLFGEVG